MPRVKRLKKFMVSVNVYPEENRVARVMSFMHEHISSRCSYGNRRARRLLVQNAALGKLSIISPISPLHALDKHLIAVRDKICIRELMSGIYEIDHDITSVVSIGVIYYNTVTCTIYWTSDLISVLYDIGLPVEIICYPAEAA